MTGGRNEGSSRARNRRSPRANERGGAAPVGEAVREYLRASGLGAKLRDWPVVEAWCSAVGQDVAEHARPVDFRRGELVVEVDSAARLAELRGFTGETYRRLANQRLRSELIRKVSFKPKQ